MTNQSASVSRWTGSDFRVGRVFGRATSIYRRNFVPFFLVSLLASAPLLLLEINAGFYSNLPLPRGAIVTLLTTIAMVVLVLLSQAVLVYGAFQDLRGRPVNLIDSMRAGLRRFFPIVGLILLAVLAASLFVAGIMLISLFAGFGFSRLSSDAAFVLLSGLAFIFGVIGLIFAALMLFVRWVVAVPVCMVEQVGPWDSLMRSSQLTKGHRLRVFGIVFVLFVGSIIVSPVIVVTLSAIGGNAVGLVASFIWDTTWGAFFAIVVVVMYYELRVAKEGVDIEQIAAVFD